MQSTRRERQLIVLPSHDAYTPPQWQHGKIFPKDALVALNILAVISCSLIGLDPTQEEGIIYLCKENLVNYTRLVRSHILEKDLLTALYYVSLSPLIKEAFLCRRDH